MFRTRPTTLIVDHGRVWCAPQERDVDVDRCTECRQFARLGTLGERRTVVCRTGGPSNRPDVPLAWGPWAG